MTKSTDILIVGGGSAGFGAAYRAVKSGACSVTVVERNPGLGGTSTYGGVNCWEPGCSGNGVHHILADRLMRCNAAFVGRTTATPAWTVPWAVSERCNDPYTETLERSFRSWQEQRRFHFEPQAMADVMLQLLKESGKSGATDFFFSSNVVSVEKAERKIAAVTVNTPTEEIRIVPKIVLDCSGEIVVARKAGCAYCVGEDPIQLYHEPNAPEECRRVVNGLTQVFRVTPCSPEYVDTVPEEYADVDCTQWLKNLDDTCCPASCFNYYPNGDININMLPTLQGESWLDLTPQETVHIARARVFHYWHWVQTVKNFRGYRIKEVFPMLGIRESYRLCGRFVLKEQDLRSGAPVDLGPDHAIAFADHPIDLHGKVNQFHSPTAFAPYGIPYECMLPKEVDNLLVACRGASFSHLACSSARLSRTMIALGEAAGEAAVQCVRSDLLPFQVDIAALRRRLKIS